MQTEFQFVSTIGRNPLSYLIFECFFFYRSIKKVEQGKTMII